MLNLNKIDKLVLLKYFGVVLGEKTTFFNPRKHLTTSKKIVFYFVPMDDDFFVFEILD